MYRLILAEDLLKNSRYLFSLSTCRNEPISALNITTFLPKPLFSDEKVPQTSNEITYPQYEYLTESTFLVNLTALNKKLINLK